MPITLRSFDEECLTRSLNRVDPAALTPKGSQRYREERRRRARYRAKQYKKREARRAKKAGKHLPPEC